MSSTIQRFPAKFGFDLALVLMGWLGDVVERIEIAGSLRRDKVDVGDVELVMTPRFQAQQGLFGATGDSINLLDQRCDELLRLGLVAKRLNKNGHAIAWGDRYKAMTFRGLPVDFFIVLPDRQWGPTMLIRTGPGSANGVLVTKEGRINHEGHVGILPAGMLLDNGVLWQEARNLNTPEEVDMFRAIRLPYIPPHLRSVEMYQFWAKARAKFGTLYAGQRIREYGYAELKWSVGATWGENAPDVQQLSQEAIPA